MVSSDFFDSSDNSRESSGDFEVGGSRERRSLKSTWGRGCVSSRSRARVCVLICFHRLRGSVRFSTDGASIYGARNADDEEKEKERERRRVVVRVYPPSTIHHT